MSERRRKPPAGKPLEYAQATGKILLEMRKQTGHSITEAAELSGLTVQVISRIEGADVEAHVFEVLKYETALGFEPGTVVRRVGKEMGR